MTANARLRGVLSPVLTPFDADLSPSIPRFVRHCRWLLEQGVGLSVFGTNSEANSLTVSEKRALLDALLEDGVPPARLMPGTGTCALNDTIALTRHAVSAGCAGVLMLPPFFYKGVSDEGLFRSYAQVIDAIGDARLRIYLYHIPSVSQVGIGFALIERLLKAHPHAIAGIKDSSGDWNNTARLLREFQSDDFDVFAGTETVLLSTLRGGGAGCITATGNVNPGPIVDLFEHWREPGADEKQQALNATRAVFQTLPMIAAMKSTVAWQAGDEGWSRLRPPLVEIDDSQRAELFANLDSRGFRMPNAAMLAA